MLPPPVARIVAASLPHIVRLSSGCKFTLSDHSYDLCSLFEAVSAPSSSSEEDLYRLNWGGDRTEGSMLTEKSTSAFIPVGRFVAPLSLSGESHHNDHHLGLRLQLEYNQDPPLYTYVHFLCDPAVAEPLNAEAASNSKDSFMWWTKHACGTPVDPGIVTALEESSSGDSNAEEEGLKGNFPSSPARQRMAILVVLLSVFCILSLFYLMYTLRAPIYYFLITYTRPIRSFFCVGESRFVRWAQEDIEQFALGEEDLMVNGDDDNRYNRYNNRRAEEEIPLKPSPRHMYLHHHYGSVI